MKPTCHEPVFSIIIIHFFQMHIDSKPISKPLLSSLIITTKTLKGFCPPAVSKIVDRDVFLPPSNVSLSGLFVSVWLSEHDQLGQQKHSDP